MNEPTLEQFGLTQEEVQHYSQIKGKHAEVEKRIIPICIVAGGLTCAGYTLFFVENSVIGKGVYAFFSFAGGAFAGGMIFHILFGIYFIFWSLFSSKSSLYAKASKYFAAKSKYDSWYHDWWIRTQQQF